MNLKKERSAAIQGLRETGEVASIVTSKPSLFACILGLAVISACQPEEVRNRVVNSSGFVEAEDLFTPVDTVRFDASVLIGSIRFVDMSGKGEFLLTDQVMRALHVFTASGDHIRTFKVTQCNPEHDGAPRSAKFLENGNIIVVTSQGAYTFNADGSCKERLPTPILANASFCERRDTVYFFSPSHRPQMHAFSIESGTIRDYDLRMPLFPRTTSVNRGYRGRQIACFERGVFYRYAESSDGEPLFLDDDPIVHRPILYRPPKRDMTSQGGDRIGELMDLAKEFTYSNGLIELDDDHRLVTFEYPAEANMNIVNMDTQTSISTSTDWGIMLAREGFLYVAGDYELLPSGEMGNKTLEVWQFHPFDLSSTESSK